MPGLRPSGTCPPNNTPCYTSGDHSAIDGEKATAEAELAVLEAEVTTLAGQLQSKTAARDAKAQLVSALTTEKNYANQNSCP